jgi:O-antigen/teichoic acid export membrane protein
MRAGRKLVAQYGFAQLYGFGVSLFTLALTARWLGPEGRGVVAAATAWAALIAGIASLSLGQALQHRLQDMAGIRLATHLGTLLAAAVALGAVAGTIAIGTHFLTAGSAFGDLPFWTIALMAVFMPVFVWEQFVAPLSGLANTLAPLSRWQIGLRTLVAVTLFALTGFGLLSAGSTLAVIWSGQLAIGLAAARRISVTAGGAHASRREFLALLPSSLRLHATTISALLLDTATILLVNEYMSKHDVGLYQLAQQMVAFLMIIPQTVSIVLTARVSKETPELYWPQQRDVLLRTSLAMLALAAIAYLLAPWIVHLIAGPQFDQSVHLFRLLMPSLAGLTLSQLLAPQWISRGLFGINALLTVGAAVLMLIGTLYGVEHSGVAGAAQARSIVFGGLVLAAQLAFVVWLNRDWRSRQASLQG